MLFNIKFVRQIWHFWTHLRVFWVLSWANIHKMLFVILVCGLFLIKLVKKVLFGLLWRILQTGDCNEGVFCLGVSVFSVVVSVCVW